MANLVLIGFGCFLGLLITEIILRGYHYYEFTRHAGEYKKVFRDERDKEYIFDHQPNANVRLRQGYTFITNSEGLREVKDYDFIEKSVIFVGDSIIEGLFLENEDILDEVFEKKTGITSLNFGLSSSNTVNEYYRLKGKYKDSYNAKLIVLGFCLNDVQDNTYLKYFDPDFGNWRFYKDLAKSDGEEYKESPVSQKSSFSPRNTFKKCFYKFKGLFYRSDALAFLYFSLRDLFGVQKTILNTKPYQASLVTEEQKMCTELYIRKIQEFAHEIDAEFLVMLFPMKNQLTIDYGDHECMQDVLIQILEKHHIAYIDFYDFMKAEYLEHPESTLYLDNIHPSREGHRMIGEYLAEKIPKMFPEIF